MSQDPLAGRDLGPYRLVRYIGHGGMGIVYEVVHRQLQVSYAIKILHPTLTQDQLMVARLRREATVALQLQHENIVQVLDYGWDQELGFYLVMELLRGRDLGELLKTKPVLTVSETASIAYQVCKALALAHQRGVIHRDMKPGNIFLLAESGEQPRVKLFDFGIARLISPEGVHQTQLTRAGKSFGTPEYMPPEQIRAMRDRIGPATDIYAFCVVIFRMLTGVLPFRSNSLIELMNQVMLQPPPMLSRFRAEFSGTEIERLLFVSMSKNPANRIQPMEAFLPQLQHAFEEDPSLKPLLELEARQAASEQTISTIHDEMDLFPQSQAAATSAPQREDHHGFTPGQTFVFGGETYSFDGKKLQATAGHEYDGQWSSRTDEQSAFTGGEFDDEYLVTAAGLASEILQRHEEDKARGHLPPPPELQELDTLYDDDTIQAGPDAIHRALGLNEEILNKLPESQLSPPSMYQDVAGEKTFTDEKFSKHIKRTLLRSKQKAAPVSLRTRLTRLFVGFLIGFVFICLGVWASGSGSSDCCQLEINSTPSQARVIEQGKLLGLTPLKLKRAKGKGLDFVVYKQNYEPLTGSWKAMSNKTLRFSLPTKRSKKR